MWYKSALLRMLIKPKSNRIAVLQKQIKWIIEHYRGHYFRRHRGNGNTTSNNNDGVVVKQLKQELAELLEEDAN